MAKVVSILLIILFEVIAILIAVFTTMYSWNNILPKLLNVELVQINFLQAIGFGYLFNLLFGHSNDDSKENNKKSDSKNKQPLIKDEFVSKELINTAFRYFDKNGDARRKSQAYFYQGRVLEDFRNKRAVWQAIPPL